MKRQVVVVGLGRFCLSLTNALQEAGHDVLALDLDARKVQSVSSDVAHVVQTDATSENALKELGVGNFDVAVVAIGSDIEASVLSTIQLKRLGVPHLIARASTEIHGTILAKIGADRVIHLENEMGNRIAHQITLRDITGYMPVTPSYGLAKLEAPYYFAGESLSSLGFGQKGRWRVAVLLVQRGKDIIITPAPSEVVQPGDTLIISGNDDHLDNLLTEVRKQKASA